MTAPKKPSRRRRTAAKDDVGHIVVPDRFAGLVGELSGVPLLKALYYLNEGERIGREAAEEVATDVSLIRDGVAALLERAQQQGFVAPPSVNRTPDPAPDPAADLAIADEVRKYATAYASGDERLANMAYARVMDDAKGGSLNSRWQQMVECIIDDAREAEAPPVDPRPELFPDFADDQPA